MPVPEIKPQPASPEKHENKKETKKKFKPKPGPQPQLQPPIIPPGPMPMSQPPVQSEEFKYPAPQLEGAADVKAMIRREIDEGIKTMVLPVIEAQMKHFAESFQHIVAKEVAMLRQSVEAETSKMQYTVRVQEALLHREEPLKVTWNGCFPSAPNLRTLWNSK